MSYNQKTLERYRADALAGRPFTCATCPYCNGERAPTVKHVHPSTKPSSPWDFWHHILLDKYRAVQSPAARHNASVRLDNAPADGPPSSGERAFVVGPMVDQSELPFRMLCRQYGATLAYTPMMHAKIFAESAPYRKHFFTTTPIEQVKAALAKARAHEEQAEVATDVAWTSPSGCEQLVDRPCIVQFCGNDADTILQAARYAVRGEYTDPKSETAIHGSPAADSTEEPFHFWCDAVDINLGCPQGIARRGHYGSFLMEDWDLVHTIIHTLHVELEVPVTVKIRVFDEEESSRGAGQQEPVTEADTAARTSLAGKLYDEVLSVYYAQMIRDAGAQLLCIHGRTREMKGQQSGLANLALIAAMRRGLGGTLPVLSNGNVLVYEDVLAAMTETGCEGHMCAEPLLWDPTLFANPPHPVLSGRLPRGADKAARIAGVRTALDYVAWLRVYPVDMGFVKAHLFKMCFHSYELHPQFRDALGGLRTSSRGPAGGDGEAGGTGADGTCGGLVEASHGASDAPVSLSGGAGDLIGALELHLKALLAAEEASDVVGEQPKTAQAEKKAAKATIIDVFEEEDDIGLSFL